MFSKLIGNDNVKRTLRHLIERRRVPNSLLLAGDPGVGKREFAIEIARSFLCSDKNGFEGCGVCSQCVRAGNFTLPTSDKSDDYKRVIFSDHLDVGTVVPFKRNIPVDAIRDLEREANFRPYEGPARFLIVDDAEKMADPAANALLKTLEEPPATTHIFLLTSRPDSLLPTIRSRVQIIRFAPVPVDEIEEFLTRERAFSRDEAKLAAPLSRGSVGRAVSINVEKFRTSRERMLRLVKDALISRDRTDMLRLSEELNDAKNKDMFEENIDTLQTLIHDIWTVSLGADPASIVNPDLADDLEGLSHSVRPSSLSAWMLAIDQMRENFAVNINRKIAADDLFMTMTG